MPKFVAIREIGGRSFEEPSVTKFKAKNHEEALKTLYGKSHDKPKRKDYNDAESFEEAMEWFDNGYEEWLCCTDQLAPGVWQMVYDDTMVILVKTA